MSADFSLLNTIAAPILAIDPDYLIQFANTRATALLGPLEYLLGSALASLTPAHHAPPTTAPCSPPKQFVQTLTDAQNQTLHITWQCVPFEAEAGWMILMALAVEPQQDRLDHLPHALHALPVMAWACPQDPALRFVNAAWQHFTEADADDAVPLMWTEWVHPDDAERCLLEYTHLLAQQPPRSIEYRLRHASGSYHWVRDYPQLVYDASGSLQGISGITVDIDDLRSAINALASSEAQFRAVTQTAADAIIICDSKQRILFWNDAARQVFGVTAQDAIGQSFTHYLAPEAQPNFERVLSSIAAHDLLEQAVTYRLRARHAEGRTFPIDVSIWEWSAQGRRYYSAALRDVSTRLQTEKRMRQLSRAVEHSPVSVVITNADAVIEYVNPRFCEVTGYSAHEIIGQNPRILQSGNTSPEDYAAMWAQIEAGEVWTGEFLNKRKDGSLYWELASISALYDEDGEIITHYVGVKEEISDRKTNEAALRDSEARLHNLIANNADGMMVIDMEGVVRFANDAALRVFGRHAQDFVGSPFGMPIIGEDAVELSVLRPDGNVCCVEMRIAEVDWAPDAAASANGTAQLVALRDVTERKQAEDALARSQARYRALFDQSNDAVFILDRYGTHLAVNQRAADLLGYSVEEIIGLSYRDVVVPSEHPHTAKFLQRLAVGERLAPYERLFRRRDGRIIPVEVNVEAVQDPETGALLHIQSIVRDISERKQIEQHIRESEAQFRAMLNSTNMAFVLLSLDYRVLIANDIAREMLRIESQRELRIGDLVTDYLGERSAKLLTTMFEQALTGETVQHQFEMTLPGQTWLAFYEMQFAPVRMEGRVIGVYARGEDITVRRAAQQREVQLQLERERVHLLSGFIRDASHEFRTPLAIIASSADLAARLPDGESKQERFVRIHQQVRRISYLLDDLLTMAKLDTEAMFTPQPTDINGLLQMALEKRRGKITEKALHIIEIYAPDLPRLNIDPYWTDVACGKLLDNALQFTPNEGTVRCETSLADGYLAITFKDSGPGIDTDNLPHIFDRFFRVDDAHTTAGFGLGLAITRRIMEKQGGQVKVSSEAGQGSTFTLWLPLAT